MTAFTGGFFSFASDLGVDAPHHFLAIAALIFASTLMRGHGVSIENTHRMLDSARATSIKMESLGIIKLILKRGPLN